MLEIKDGGNIYLGKAAPGGGESYSAGSGIVISGGQIAATSTLLQDVGQVISSGYVAKSDSPDGGYFYITGSGATLGASGTYRISAGSNAAAVKTNTSTGLYLSGNGVVLMNSGKLHYSATPNVAALYGSSTEVSLQLGSSYVTIKHSSDTNYERVVHVGMSATPDTPGIVQPDNSTCTVISGGILSMIPLTTMWTSGNAGSEVTYSSLDGGTVQRVYKNGLLMQSGVDYDVQSGGVVSYATPVESSDKVAFEYYPAPAQEPGRGVKGVKSGDDDGWKEEAEPEEKEPEKGGEER